jgi:hypothetical protein
MLQMSKRAETDIDRRCGEEKSLSQKFRNTRPQMIVCGGWPYLGRIDPASAHGRVMD